ncbi:hypothetical protein ABH922_001932 [Rhodococcus sp. 27YEA15]|uniref:hypothetical protein n=1 Tax=Rhodococcus sp. 27YEA15 TaxID=3156259 RepID=UPI003C7A9EBA
MNHLRHLDRYQDHVPDYRVPTWYSWSIRTSVDESAAGQLRFEIQFDRPRLAGVIGSDDGDQTLHGTTSGDLRRPLYGPVRRRIW